MNRINASSGNHRICMVRQERFGCRCDDCGWAGRRVVRIVVDCVGGLSPSPEELESGAQIERAQYRSALHQLREMRSYPNCPRCSGEVYCVPIKAKRKA